MFEFKETLIVTGIEEKTSRNNIRYKVAYFLGENGKTFSCVLDCEISKDIKQLDRVEAKFKLTPGRYTNLRVIEMKKVE